MSNSIFFNQLKGRRFPIPLLAIEIYSDEARHCTTEDEVFDVFFRVITDICGVRQPTDEDLTYFVDRLDALRKEMEQNETQETKKAVRSFGTAYHEYLSNLMVDSRILRMVGYNFDVAKKIYCELDRDDAMKLVNEYMTGLLEEGLLNMEAAMYGFGGKYKDDKGGSKANVHDLTTDEGKKALKRLGF
jgi:hypothetical protein